MKYKLLNDNGQQTYALILDYNEEVLDCLLSFARSNQLTAAQFTGIGALSRATLGFFDFSIKDYKKIEIEQQVEVLTMAGDISIFKNEPKVHAHIVVGKEDGTAHGGHLLHATVHPTLEIIITESPAFLKRKMDAQAGIPLISIEADNHL